LATEAPGTKLAWPHVSAGDESESERQMKQQDASLHGGSFLLGPLDSSLAAAVCTRRFERSLASEPGINRSEPDQELLSEYSHSAGDQNA
jgi:hypothetical protein